MPAIRRGARMMWIHPPALFSRLWWHEMQHPGRTNSGGCVKSQNRMLSSQISRCCLPPIGARQPDDGILALADIVLIVLATLDQFIMSSSIAIRCISVPMVPVKPQCLPQVPMIWELFSLLIGCSDYTIYFANSFLEFCRHVRQTKGFYRMNRHSIGTCHSPHHHPP